MNVHPLPQRSRVDADAVPAVRAPRLRDAEPPRVGIGSLFRIFLARRLTILCTVLLGLGAGAVVLTQMAPLYSATALVAVGERSDAAAEQSVVGLTKEAAAVEAQLQMLRSAALATAVVAKMDLAGDVELQAGPASFLDNWNPAAWLAGPAPKIAPAAVHPTVDPDVLRRFASRLTVSSEGQAGIARVTFAAADPRKAAQIANTIVETYLSAQAGAPKAVPETEDEQLTRLADRVRSAEEALARFKTEGAAPAEPAADSSALADEQLSELKAQIAAARANLAEREAKHRQVSKLANDGVDPEAIVSATNAPQLVRALEKQTELARQEAELSVKYGERHPRMIALRDEIETADAKVADEVKRVVKALAGAVTVARSRLASLESSLTEMQAGAPVAAAPVPAPADAGAGTLRELEDELAASRAALEQYRTAKSAAGAPQATQAKMVRPAVAPREPDAPDLPMIMGVSLFGSALVGMLLALVMERMTRGFRTGDEIERLSRLPNLAVVPRLKGERHIADRIVQAPMSAYSESVRSLHSALQLSGADRPPKVVVMTSSIPHEGKTSLAVSLGRLASKGGARVILIDGDLRHPSVSGQFTPRRPEAGLVEVLTGGCTLRDVLHRDPISPLEFVPVAAPPSNPSELLGSMAMKRMLDILRQHYDLIVIDAAPVLPVADTRLLSRVADKIVYVVGWEKTPRQAVVAGLRSLLDANAEIAGTVLNQADMRRYALYSHGSASYGYGTKYARYYAD